MCISDAKSMIRLDSITQPLSPPVYRSFVPTFAVHGASFGRKRHPLLSCAQTHGTQAEALLRHSQDIRRLVQHVSLTPRSDGSGECFDAAAQESTARESLETDQQVLNNIKACMCAFLAFLDFTSHAVLLSHSSRLALP